MGSGAIRRRSALAMAVLTGSGLLTVAVPAQAQAAPLCTGRKVRTLPFSTGAVQLYKSGRWLCAVTVAKDPGTRRTMSVSVQARGSVPVPDAGHYERYAGPVIVHDGRRCVWVTGRVGRGALSSKAWILADAPSTSC
ncbi:hypothetical protein [Streptomyces sp. TRM68367]|uniref:hypothetical protein n=1 Tax=Streptomyces sp. TRM68367 TaxID=2758415 RepID=UPI00165A19B2|nr:hypothetical protein [Streptomyces sp. TRM68367]MBC9725186.1 hypothetical protein [Streptomyces sp. TRM68367]